MNDSGRRTSSTIDLYWLPLGAGGWFVRFNGQAYEALQSLMEDRPRRALYHSALVVTTPDGRFVVENAWPIPDSSGWTRGSVREGPVLSRRLGALRAFRYEIRRWKDGTIADLNRAVDSPVLVSRSPAQARRLLQLAAAVPAMTWGRDERGLGDMWNSNSVISWLLQRSGTSVESIPPPPGGRAPGWDAGLAVARLDEAFPHLRIKESNLDPSPPTRPMGV